jgi:SAM-dependent methyltransferase
MSATRFVKLGERVVDLGSGGGFDCFVAAGQVGPEGQVVGVDMTEEMLSRARGGGGARAASGRVSPGRDRGFADRGWLGRRGDE